MSKEKRYHALMQRINEDMKSLVNQRMIDFYTDHLPFIEEDCQSNMEIELSNIMKKLVLGQYKEDEGHITVETARGHYSLNIKYESATIIKRHRELIQNQRILELEQEIEFMTRGER